MSNSRQSENISGSQRRQQVSMALNGARAAFGAQHTEQDGVKFQEACERLGRFLDLAIPMRDTEQIALVQILQLACAMHENAINNPALTRAQRTIHRNASCDLTVVCNKARDNNILTSELKWEVAGLSYRAEKAFAEDFSRCFFMDNWAEEGIYGPAAPSPVPAPSYLPSPRAPNGFHAAAPSVHIPSYSPAPRVFSYNANYNSGAPRPVQSNVFRGSGNGAGSNTVPSPVFIPYNADDSHYYQR
ncbi:hypothetical protein JVU11DRAFT_7050 [Chiua virens]|nr:hypothetical protein JVU11DRAFT_7050 [Chiua virens]